MTDSFQEQSWSEYTLRYFYFPVSGLLSSSYDRPMTSPASTPSSTPSLPSLLGHVKIKKETLDHPHDSCKGEYTLTLFQSLQRAASGVLVWVTSSSLFSRPSFRILRFTWISTCIIFLNTEGILLGTCSSVSVFRGKRCIPCTQRLALTTAALNM